MKVMISQPRYLPALNYLRRIAQVDRLVIYDTCQRTERGFENRNKLILRGEPRWLTIPCDGSSRQLIHETKVFPSFYESHKSSVIQSYRKAPFFDMEFLNELYSHPTMDYLTCLVWMLKNIKWHFGLETELILASELTQKNEGIETLKEICRISKATEYVTGITAKEYGLEMDSFESIGCEIVFDNWKPAPYKQQTENFVPYMGFLDCLFNVGKEETLRILKS